MKKYVQLFLIGLSIIKYCPAQTIYSQNFGAGTSLPTGWSSNSGVSQIANESVSVSSGYTIPSTPAGSAVVSGGSNLSFRDCAKNTTSPVVVTFNGVSTIGLNNIILGLGNRETNGFGNIVTLKASTDGGANFNQTISSDLTASSSTTWQYNTFSLGAWADNVSNIIFQFSYIPDANSACTSSSVSTFRIDDFYLGANGVLPVKLNNFSAETLSNSIELKWKTSEEINVNRFEIERSADAKEFYKIEEVKAKNEANTYFFSDFKAEEGINYYRLKMIDNDDFYEYSKIISAEFGSETQVFSLIQNPVKNDQIGFLSQNYGIENIRFSSINGQDIPFELSKESSFFRLKPVNQIASGLYLISVFDKKTTKTLRVLVE